MKDLVVLAAPCLMLAMLYCCWRAVALVGVFDACIKLARP